MSKRTKNTAEDCNEYENKNLRSEGLQCAIEQKAPQRRTAMSKKTKSTEEDCNEYEKKSTA